MTMREQGDKEEKCGGSQSVGHIGGGEGRGGEGWRGGQSSRLKRYHSIAHLSFRWPARVFYSLTCPGHIREGGGGRTRITIIIQQGLCNQRQHRGRRELSERAVKTEWERKREATAGY